MLARSFLALTALVVGTQAVPQGHKDPWSSKSWQKFIQAPDAEIVKPSHVISVNTTGDVSNPNGMIKGHGPTVLSRGSTDDKAPSVVVDFGKNVVGLLRVHFKGSKSGSDALPGLKLAFSETYEALGNTSDYTRSYRGVHEEDKLTNGTDQIAVKNEKYTWLNQLGCEHDHKVCADGLHGFRYVRIWVEALEADAPYTTSVGEVSIDSIDLEWSAYLGTPDTYTGWFECSDEDMTQWWYDGVYTVDTNVDYFLKNETEPRDAFSPTLDGKWVLFDGAKRDRDPYVGDIAVAGLTSYLSHDFPEAARNVLEDLAIHQRDDGWIPPASINNYTLPLFDYPAWWVVCSVDLILYTGDMDYASKYWTALAKVLDTYYPKYIDSKSGILNKADSSLGDYAFLPRSGPVTYYSALYIHALDYSSQLAEKLGHKDDADRWSKRAEAMRPNLLAKNFDSGVGAFYDGGPCPDKKNGTVCDVHAQDGNSIAILAGVTNETTSTQILDYWAKNTRRDYGNAFYDSTILSPNDDFDKRVYALISYFELSARFSTKGTEASALEEIRRLYGWMATHDPQITQWEGIGPTGGSYQGPFMSYSHGWSTGIVSLMSNYVLGVKPTAPGFSEWRVCPVVEGDLTWAKGVVPTANGSIKVSWEKKSVGSADMLTLRVEAPQGTKGVICVPDMGGASEVQVNGAKKSAKSKEIEVQGGDHTIVVKA